MGGGERERESERERIRFRGLDRKEKKVEGTPPRSAGETRVGSGPEHGSGSALGGERDGGERIVGEDICCEFCVVKKNREREKKRKGKRKE